MDFQSVNICRCVTLLPLNGRKIQICSSTSETTNWIENSIHFRCFLINPGQAFTLVLNPAQTLLLWHRFLMKDTMSWDFAIVAVFWLLRFIYAAPKSAKYQRGYMTSKSREFQVDVGMQWPGTYIYFLIKIRNIWLSTWLCTFKLHYEKSGKVGKLFTSG